MAFMRKLLSYYRFTTLCVIVIWVLCLIPIPETPLDNISMIDKWTHFVLYGGLCSVAWAEYGFRHLHPVNRKVWIYTIVLPIVMGGLIEIVQATCTGGTRSGDVMDWLADIIGVALGQLIGIPLALLLSRRRKDAEACKSYRSGDRQ